MVLFTVTELSRDLHALNDSGAIKGMDARKDGVYITYVATSGADTVTKKLGCDVLVLRRLTYQCNKSVRLISFYS